MSADHLIHASVSAPPRATHIEDTCLDSAGHDIEVDGDLRKQSGHDAVNIEAVSKLARFYAACNTFACAGHTAKVLTSPHARCDVHVKITQHRQIASSVVERCTARFCELDGNTLVFFRKIGLRRD